MKENFYVSDPAVNMEKFCIDWDKVESSFRQLGISFTREDGSFKSGLEVWRELADVWRNVISDGETI